MYLDNDHLRQPLLNGAGYRRHIVVFINGGIVTTLIGVGVDLVMRDSPGRSSTATT